MPVTSTDALYIKLGQAGEWEKDCIREGTLKLGYRELNHELCQESDWLSIEQQAQAIAKGQGAARRHVSQVRQFYEAPASTLWITFHSDRLWWCFANTDVTELDDQTKIRQTTDGWHDHDVNGARLFKALLSGKLLATEGFQGTICSVSEREYLLHKINGTAQPHVLAAQQAHMALIASLVPIVQNLHHKDLELLTDLIFRQSGWNRIGVTGGTTKDIDLDLLSPITGERVAVQVKSRAGAGEYDAYRRTFTDMRGYARFYFVTHSPTRQLALSASEAVDPSFIFWGASELAAHAARSGLTGWLLDKAS